MAEFTCPIIVESATFSPQPGEKIHHPEHICGAKLQATRKIYSNIDPETGELSLADLDDSWVIYCEDDHQVAPDLWEMPSPDDIRALLVPHREQES